MRRDGQQFRHELASTGEVDSQKIYPIQHDDNESNRCSAFVVRSALRKVPVAISYQDREAERAFDVIRWQTQDQLGRTNVGIQFVLG
jgi:hypothetical protein